MLGGDFDLVVLARYMQILSRRLPAPRRRAGDQHPPLASCPPSPAPTPTPARASAGVKLIGATAHYVTEELDAGPIIEQDIARVSHRDSAERLARIGRDVERTVLARAVGWQLEDRVLLDEQAHDRVSAVS